MNIKEFIEKRQLPLFSRISDIAIFKDKENNINLAIIESDYSSNIDIYIYNQELELIGTIKMKHKPYESIYIYNLYVDANHRKLNIASHILEIVEYEMYHLRQTKITGIFEPFEFSQDKKNLIHNSEINGVGKKFYIMNNFELITYETYIKNRKKYSSIYPCNFGITKANIILYKEITNFQINFRKINGLLIHNNTLIECTNTRRINKSKTLKLT